MGSQLYVIGGIFPLFLMDRSLRAVLGFQQNERKLQSSQALPTPTQAQSPPVNIRPQNWYTACNQ